jgi:hypothetical protein
MEEPEDDEPEDLEEENRSETKVPGEGVIGCSVAVCLAAPVAAVEFSDRELFADGSSGAPEIGRYTVDESGEPVPPETEYRSRVSPEAFQGLESLRAKIVAVLRKYRLEAKRSSWKNPSACVLLPGTVSGLQLPLRVPAAHPLNEGLRRGHGREARLPH